MSNSTLISTADVNEDYITVLEAIENIDAPTADAVDSLERLRELATRAVSGS